MMEAGQTPIEDALGPWALTITALAKTTGRGPYKKSRKKSRKPHMRPPFAQGAEKGQWLDCDNQVLSD